jgi:ribonuclease J
MSGRGDIVGDPWVDMTGLPEEYEPKKSMQDLVADAVDDAITSLPKARRRDPAALEQAIERSVRGAVNNVWGKKPVCHVLILQV